MGNLPLPSPVIRALTKLGRDISLARRRRRMTQESLAERIGASGVGGDMTTRVLTHRVGICLGKATSYLPNQDTARRDRRLPLSHGFSIRVQDSAARPSDTAMVAVNEAHPEAAANPSRRSTTSMW